MAYRIAGISGAPFRHLEALSDVELEKLGVRRMTADSPVGFPCRILLEDAQPGQRLLLVNHVSHDVKGPYRTAHAIFVAEGALEPAEYRDRIPPALDRRILSLRGFDERGMMIDAVLAQPGTADETIRALFADGQIAYIHAHNAVRGCFAAKVERS